jgi:F-box/leucine-rich repeat protein 2/20
MLSLDLGGTRLRDAGLEKLAISCTHLASLDIRFCPHITEKGARVVAMYCRNLKSLCLDGGTNMSEALGEALAAGCPFLQKLMLFTGVSTNSANLGIEKLTSGQPIFTSLEFSLKSGVTDACIKKIAASPCLSELWLNSCYKVTEAGILSLATGCKSLRSIQLNHCSNVTDWGLSRIWTSCRHIKINVGQR